MRKILWIVLIAVFAMWGLSGCGGSEEVVASEQISEESDETVEEVVASEENVEDEEVIEVEEVVEAEEMVERVADADGINLGNIANSNFWTFQGSELFYTANYDVGIYNLETGELSKVENHGGNHSYVVGNDIYFSHITGIRRADLNTGEYVQLTNLRARYINVHEDWVYFVNTMDNDTIYRMKTDGSDSQQLSTFSSVRCLIQYDGYLYFNPYSEYNKLYRMKIDGSEDELWLEQSVVYMCVNDGYLYFFNEEDAERRVHRMRYDSKELELMNLPNSI